MQRFSLGFRFAKPAVANARVALEKGAPNKEPMQRFSLGFRFAKPAVANARVALEKGAPNKEPMQRFSLGAPNKESF